MIVPTIKITIKMSHRQETLLSKGPAACRYTLLTVHLRLFEAIDVGENTETTGNR